MRISARSRCGVEDHRSGGRLPEHVLKLTKGEQIRVISVEPRLQSEGRDDIDCAMLTTMTLLASAVTEAQTLTIARGGSRPSSRRRGELHGYRSCRDAVRDAGSATRECGSVTFEPVPHGVAFASGRPDPHRHGRHRPRAAWGDRLEEIRTGDVVGSRRTRSTGTARRRSIHDAHRDHRTTRGTNVQWMEKVTDEQYSAAPAGSEPQPVKPQQTTARPSGPVQQRLAPDLRR